MNMPPSRWIKFLPLLLRNRVEGRANLIKAINNIGWLLFDKMVRLVFGFSVGVWIARYLGPEQFGSMSYAIALVAMFSAVASLGLNGIVVRDLIARPEDAPITLGTTFLLQIFGGGGALILALATIAYVKPGDNLARTMVLIFSLANLFKASEVIKYWFESKVQARSIVLVECSIFVFVSLIKIFMIVTGASLMVFVTLVLFEAFLIAVGYFVRYASLGNRVVVWHFQYQRAKRLLTDSWPLILSGLAAMFYMRVDQIMIGHMLGDAEVGIFSAAARITETFYILPAMIVGSVFPAILEAKNHGNGIYYSRLMRLFNLMAILALMIAIPFSFFSSWIVEFLYGQNYEAASAVLSIQVWASVFVFSGVASSRWFLIENLQRYSFYRTIAGAVINVILNYFFIPLYGVVGAAWSTLVSQAVASVFFNYSSSETRGIFFMQIKALTGISLFQK